MWSTAFTWVCVCCDFKVYKMEIRNQLQSLRKWSTSINEYVETVKELSTQLTDVGYFVPKQELILYIFNSLNSDYNPCICSINNKTDDVFMVVCYLV